MSAQARVGLWWQPSAVSFLVGLALGVMAQYAAFSARLAVLEDLRPKVNAIYDALIERGVIKPPSTHGAP